MKQPKIIAIDNLIVNPLNARLVVSDPSWTELETMDNLILSEGTRIVDLARDIHQNGLQPHNSLIVYKGENGKYILAEGNRRITSIKLMSIYKDRVSEMKLSRRYAEQIGRLSVDIESVSCVVYDHEHQTRELVRNIHDSKSKGRRSAWDPLAQERNNEKDGLYTKALSVLDVVYHSQYSSQDIKNKIISIKSWYSKLQHTAPYSYFQYLLGIRFDKENNLYIELDEVQVIRALETVLTHMMSKDYPSNEYFQKHRFVDKYLDEVFPTGLYPSKSSYSENVIKFVVADKTFEIISRDIKESPYYVDGEEKKREDKATQENPNTSTSTSIDQEKEKPNKDKGKNGLNEEPTAEQSNGGADKGNSNPTPLKHKRKVRTHLILEDEINIPNKYTKIRNLHDELMSINLRNINCISMGLRSLIEYSINSYLIEVKNDKATPYNINIGFVEKIRRVVYSIEGKKGYGKKMLMKLCPAVYEILGKDPKVDYEGIPALHLFVHHHDYQADPGQLVGIYDKFKLFLKIIWNVIESH